MGPTEIIVARAVTASEVAVYSFNPGKQSTIRSKMSYGKTIKCAASRRDIAANNEKATCLTRAGMYGFLVGPFSSDGTDPTAVINRACLRGSHPASTSALIARLVLSLFAKRAAARIAPIRPKINVAAVAHSRRPVNAARTNA